MDIDVYDRGAIHEGDLYQIPLRNKNDGYKWALVVVYGPAQEELKINFDGISIYVHP